MKARLSTTRHAHMRAHTRAITRAITHARQEHNGRPRLAMSPAFPGNPPGQISLLA